MYMIINMIALMGLCRTAIRRFSGFPAVSLPRLRFGGRVARKMLIRRTFRFEASPKKIFTLSFPERQGKGGGGATLPSFVPSASSQLFLQGSGSLREITRRTDVAAAEAARPGLVVSLGDKQMLLVLDNCSHVIEAAASLAVGILRGAPRVHILATSREPLRVEGERVYRLSSLASPPVSARLNAASALAFPAVQLFVERTTENSGDFELSDADAPFVGDVCRKLDGHPLAIELAAARVEAFGVPRPRGASGRPLAVAHQRPPHGGASTPDPERHARSKLWSAQCG